MATTPTPQVTYAGVPLLLPDERLQAHLDRHWRPGPEWQHPGYTAPGTLHLPRPYPPEPTRPRLGVLRWPTGASRWATYYGLADKTALDQIRIGLSKSRYARYDSFYPLVMSDGVSEISADMHMLPPRPMASKLGNDLYLITLVDYRYWIDIKNAGLPVRAGYPDSSFSWASVLTTLLQNAGFVTPDFNGADYPKFTIDAVPSAYGYPSTALDGIHGCWSVVLDSVASMVGARLVFQLGRTVNVSRYDTARTSLESQYAQYDGVRCAGGRLDQRDLFRAMPPKVGVRFGDAAGNDITNPVYVQCDDSQTLTLVPEFAAVDLSKTAFVGNVGVGGACGLICANQVLYRGGQSGVTPSDISDYAYQAAADWWRWQLADVEATYAGIAPWHSTGLEDAIEWEIGLGDDSATTTAETRLIRAAVGSVQSYAEMPRERGFWAYKTDTGYQRIYLDTSTRKWMPDDYSPSGYIYGLTDKGGASPVGAPGYPAPINYPESAAPAGGLPDVPTGTVVRMYRSPNTRNIMEFAPPPPTGFWATATTDYDPNNPTPIGWQYGSPQPVTGTAALYGVPKLPIGSTTIFGGGMPIKSGSLLWVFPTGRTTADGPYYCTPWGFYGEQQFTVYRYTTVSGNLVETPHTVTITGRDLTVSVS